LQKTILNILLSSSHASVPSIPEYPGEFPDGPHPALGGGDVMDDGNGEDGVEALVPVGQGQVVAQQDLQTCYESDRLAEKQVNGKYLFLV